MNYFGKTKIKNKSLKFIGNKWPMILKYKENQLINNHY